MARFSGLVAFALLLAAPAYAQDFEQAAAAYQRGDLDAARKAWRALAENGDAQSQFMLGAIYATGKGVPRDHAEAAKWYLMAAKQGVAAAQNNLGFMYDRGLGVAKNDHEAVRWYIKAAQQGHSQAQNNLGVMYGTGRGVAKNNTQAFKWFQLSAEQGNPQAHHNLGILRSKEESQVAEAPAPKPDAKDGGREVSITEQSATSNDPPVRTAPGETQVASVSEASAVMTTEHPPEKVRLETIVRKKVSPQAKLAERTEKLAPRPAPTTDDAGPVGELAKLDALKRNNAKPRSDAEVMKAATPNETAEPKAVAARARPETPVTDLASGADHITLTAKTQIAALASDTATQPVRNERPQAAKAEPAEKAAPAKTPSPPVLAKAEPAAPVAKNPPIEAKKAQPKTPSYQIQLGSVKTTSGVNAAKAADRLEKTYASVLDGVKVSTERADLGAKGIYYRFRAGPFAGYWQARDVCDKLANRNQSCLVIRR